MERVMKHLLILSLLPLALSPLVAGHTPAKPDELSSKQKTELDTVIRGRTAGPKMACVQQRDLGSNRSIGEGMILFEGKGRTLYINRPPAGCSELTFNKALVTKTYGDRLCRGDIVKVVDIQSGIDFGSCSLGDFTPYR